MAEVKTAPLGITVTIALDPKELVIFRSWMSTSRYVDASKEPTAEQLLRKTILTALPKEGA